MAVKQLCCPNDSKTQRQCGTSLWWLYVRHPTCNRIAGVAQSLAVAPPPGSCLHSWPAVQTILLLIGRVRRDASSSSSHVAKGVVFCCRSCLQPWHRHCQADFLAWAMGLGSVCCLPWRPGVCYVVRGCFGLYGYQKVPLNGPWAAGPLLTVTTVQGAR